jgi:hypothetical protein
LRTSEDAIGKRGIETYSSLLAFSLATKGNEEIGRQVEVQTHSKKGSEKDEIGFAETWTVVGGTTWGPESTFYWPTTRILDHN